MVAGATKADLVNDLRGAVDSAITEGTTLEQFRKDFDGIVGKHGWDYKGGRNWRTKVIYDTNLRTSHAAGRWQQLQATKATRPYWRYRHSNASIEPRPEHLGWDGLTLDADDPWWHSHAPPNGWGCQCYIESLSKRDLTRAGKDQPDKAPPTKRRNVNVNGRGLQSVPEGIDPGFAYAPGRVSQLGEITQTNLLASAKQSVKIAAQGVKDMLGRPATPAALAEKWKLWRRESVGQDGKIILGGSEAMVPGALNPNTVTALGERGIEPATATITITRSDLAHLMDENKRKRGAGLEGTDLDRLTEIFHKPEAVLLDTKDNSLLYIATASNQKGKLIKVVVRLNYKDELHIPGDKFHRQSTNSIRTAGYVTKRDLGNRRYEAIEGDVTE